ncbi:MAG TPA: hypothetical protein PKH92_04960 [Anaerolineaceae bacterium]|nr:hypothetical protein [Anaerolineaceae bacterium]
MAAKSDELQEALETRQELNRRMIELQGVVIARIGALDQSVYQEELKRLGLIKLWEDNEKLIKALKAKSARH